MNIIVKNMKDGNYNLVFDQLQQVNYDYSLEHFTHDFAHVDSIKKYCYLIYVMAKMDIPKIHMLICDILMFTDTFFNDVYTVIHWNIDQALRIDPYNIEAMSWAINVFYNHPDSPFSKKELYDFASFIISKDPNDKRAIDVISEYKEVN